MWLYYFDIMWSNIRTGIGPARPNEGTTWFKSGLGYCFCTLDWYGTVQKFFRLVAQTRLARSTIDLDRTERAKHDRLGPA
jgi:hypothetical protein